MGKCIHNAVTAVTVVGRWRKHGSIHNRKMRRHARTVKWINTCQPDTKRYFPLFTLVDLMLSFLIILMFNLPDWQPFSQDRASNHDFLE
jgi:hypothetical protein